MKKSIIFGILILAVVIILGCTGEKNINDETIVNENQTNVKTPGAIGTNCEMTFLREDKLAYGSMHVLYYDGYSIDCSCFNSNPELNYYKSDFSTRYFAYFFGEELNNPNYVIDEVTSAGGINADVKYCTFGKKLGENPDYLYCEPFQISMDRIDSDGIIRAKDELIIDSIFLVDLSYELENTGDIHFPVKNAELIAQTCTVWKAK